MVSLDERVFHVLSVKRIMKRKEEEKKEIKVISEKGKAREDSSCIYNGLHLIVVGFTI